MAVNRIPVYEGGFLNADTSNTAGAAVVRDPSTGGINVGPVNAGALANAGTESVTGAAPLTGTTTLTTSANAIIPLDATSAAFTTTLPAAAAAGSLPGGMRITFFKKDSSANVPTIKGSGAELIGGANTYAALTAQYNYITLWCNGTQWYWLAKG